ncbi:glycosyltransferase [Devosia sp.]|uniref:glycosyltransferase n=1 Tax=Devosia sp. TaxID=1871048 RepID=UPI001AC91BD1|nr:glycosyltransferase [Devosia sp.]MBN9308377.1 glycosyltransferase [Devosia sp.]
MRILHSIRSVNPAHGGTASAILSLASEAMHTGHSVEVASLDAGNERFVAGYPVPLHCLGPGLGKYGFTARLSRWVRANATRFDGVVLHGVWDFSSLGSWLGLRGLAVPYVIYTHGMLDPWFRKGRPVKHSLKQAYWLLAQGWVLADAASVLFTCEEERRLARGSFLGLGYTERVVAFGSSDAPPETAEQVAAFHRAIPNVAGRRYLLFLGRIHPKKGGDLLVKSFMVLAAANPQIDLVMAGPDDMGLRQAVQHALQVAGLDGRVHWPGMLAGDVKWGALRGALAFVLPSHQENFGIAVAEAMASGTPVVISNKVNIWREVVEGGGGVVADDTLGGTLSAISTLIALPAERRRDMGLAARATYERHFTVEAAGRDLIEALSEAVATRAGGA